MNLKENKLDADWTYLMMKISQMRENIDINGKDTEKGTNERTKEKSKNSWMKYWVKDSRNLRKSRFSGTSIGCFGNIAEIFRQLPSTIFHVKKITRVRGKNPKTAISGIFDRKSTLTENSALSYFRYCHFALVCKISWKNIKYSSRDSRNTVIPAKIGCSSDF